MFFFKQYMLEMIFSSKLKLTRFKIDLAARAETSYKHHYAYPLWLIIRKPVTVFLWGQLENSSCHKLAILPGPQV